jgi:predicted DNA binding CopG/RHH family protein
MKARTADYTDDQGEIIGDLRPIADTLPPPDQLVPRDDTVKVTLALSRRSVDFFKREAAKHHVPYQRMIRALVDEYTRRMG